MRVLVTGGAGFIGSNLVLALVGAGHEVVTVDDLSTGKPENVHPGSDFRHMDVLDPAFAELATDCRPEGIVHLAAQASVAVSVRDPEFDRRVNVEGTRAVARAAAASRARRVVFASTAALYGEPSVIPVPEDAPKAPESPYGASKLQAERLLADELVPSGVDVCSLRFANVYGPRQDAAGEGGVVAVFATELAAGRAPAIHGTGEQTRDFVFVHDVVECIEAVLDREEALAGEGQDRAAFNVSTGVETSVADLARRLASITGFTGRFKSAPAREGDLERSALDPGKAAEVLGWRARTDLSDGLGVTAEWFSRTG